MGVRYFKSNKEAIKNKKGSETVFYDAKNEIFYLAELKRNKINNLSIFEKDKTKIIEPENIIIMDIKKICKPIINGFWNIYNFLKINACEISYAYAVISIFYLLQVAYYKNGIYIGTINHLTYTITHISIILAITVLYIKASNLIHKLLMGEL